MKGVTEGRRAGKRPGGRERKGMLSELEEDGYVNIKRRTKIRVSLRKWMPKKGPVVEQNA